MNQSQNSHLTVFVCVLLFQADYAERFDNSQSQVRSLHARLEEVTEFAKEKEATAADIKSKHKSHEDTLQAAYKVNSLCVWGHSCCVGWPLTAFVWILSLTPPHTFGLWR